MTENIFNNIGNWKMIQKTWSKFNVFTLITFFNDPQRLS